MSSNIPSILATTILPLLHGMERALSGNPLPEGCTSSLSPSEGLLALSRGKSILSLPLEHAEQLRQVFDGQELAHLFRLAPLVLTAMFRLARQDYLAGIGSHGAFALTPLDRESEQLRPMRRLCRACGMDPDSSQLESIQRAFLLLRCLHLTTEIKGETLTIAGLVSCPKSEARYLRGIEIGNGYYRGGYWAFGQIHPVLFAMAFKRFFQLEEEAFSLSPRDFNTYITARGQAACRQTSELHIGERRLITDAGHSQTTTRGDAREKHLLNRSLSRLIEAGLLVAASMKEAGKWIVELVPQTLLHIEPEPPNPAAPPPPEPETLLHALSEMLKNQEFTAQVLALVRTLAKSDSSAPSPFPAEVKGAIGSQGVPI